MKAILAVVGLVVGFFVQSQISGHIAEPGWRPDFLLAVLLTLALFIPSKTLAFAGFIAGVLEGAACGMFMGAFIISRSAGALTASLIAEPLHLNVVVAVAVVAVSSAVTQIVFLLVQATPDLVWWLGIATRQTILTAILAGLFFPIAVRTIHQDVSLED